LSQGERGGDRTTAAQDIEALADAIRSPSSPSSGRVAELLVTGAAQVATTLTRGGGPSDRGQWLSLVGSCQSLINTLTAVQDTALAQAACRESEWCEDGTLGETVHAPGRVTLDAADLAAPLLGASHAQAQRRVELAVRLAADRVPVPAEHRGPPETSGLRALHTAMAQGRLDGFRAGVVAFELDTAPADVADAVVTSLDSHLGDDAAKLRQRIRVLLARISPDLVRERAQKARNNTGLRRWVAEPGVDEWHGTFPSEDAATAWAAIDRLAHDLVAAGTCTNVEQARGKALTDLVTGHSTVDVQVVLTVPADCVPTSARAPQGDEPAATIRTSTPDTNVSAPACAAEDPTQTPATDVSAPARAAEELSPTQDTGDGASVTPLDGGRDHDLVQVQGARPSEPLLVRRGWLRDHLAKQPPRPKRGRAKVSPAFVPCDPLTGARLDPHDHLTTDAYRPSAELTALVKVRDGRCRFPGCIRRRPVLRPRPRATLAGRTHRRAQPAHPVPTPPPHQTTTGLACTPGTRRVHDLDRPHRPAPYHQAPGRPAGPGPRTRAHRTRAPHPDRRHHHRRRPRPRNRYHDSQRAHAGVQRARDHPRGPRRARPGSRSQLVRRLHPPALHLLRRPSSRHRPTPGTRSLPRPAALLTSSATHRTRCTPGGTCHRGDIDAPRRADVTSIRSAGRETSMSYWEAPARCPCESDPESVPSSATASGAGGVASGHSWK
jgi:hypothetical protein